MQERSRERKHGPYRTFRKEREEPEPIRDGAFESVLVAVKDVLSLTPNETTGMGDMDFWIGIEDAASLTPQEACMDFYIHNIGHRTLAQVIVPSFYAVRSASSIDKEQRRVIMDRVANKLLEYYPPKYRAKFG